jgi:hypothetical protein
MKKEFSIVIFILIHFYALSQDMQGKKDLEEYDTINFFNELPQPPWKFIDNIKKPLWTEHNWVKLTPEPGHADLSKGVTFKKNFLDPNGRLETAYVDLRQFLLAGKVSTGKGKYIIETSKAPDLISEDFRLVIEPEKCLIVAGDVEGIRRGIFHIEDEMLRLKGPYLPLGSIQKKPIIQRRISRCFFGPIKRPGNVKGAIVGDELVDEVDYYPDQYLNRLSHEGVNGLWITVSSKMGDGSSVGFSDLVSTSVTKIKDINAEKRLSKLRDVVKKCLRYGIRVYIKTMEPHVPVNAIKDSILKFNPDILGNNNKYLCAGSKIGQQYLYESVNKIFKAVPELGGIINISHGELYTSCLSGLNATGEGSINCIRCSRLKPWQILDQSLSAIEKGMHDAAPNAELISWLYMPQPQSQTENTKNILADWVYEIASHTSKNIILQFNFESGVAQEEFGKELIGGDYWTSVPGPSQRFERIAELAKQNGTNISAKIQTGTSYEIATVPFVPVPSILYQKFAAMKRLGVSHTMLNWIVGASPGMMNKAAGMLSFEPFPDEAAFLQQLASYYWKGEDVTKIIHAWTFFSKGYSKYPLSNLFQYYGPMNDGPVWPLYLKPKDMILSPTYQIGSRITAKPWPPSGDRVGESFSELLTLEEVVELCKHICANWDQGLKILNELESKYVNEPDRILDIGLANAIGIQFHSSYNIMNFYYLREKMLNMEGMARLDILKELGQILLEEIELDQRLILLCERDPRLGFHADAEGYKYYPKKIEWRMKQLRYVLENDLPEIKKLILEDKLLFPEYTGKKPSGNIMNSLYSFSSLYPYPKIDSLAFNSKYQWRKFEFGPMKDLIRWTSAYDNDALYVIVSDSSILKGNLSVYACPLQSIKIKIEPRRLYPCKNFNFDLKAETRSPNVRVLRSENGFWYGVVRIPFRQIGLKVEHLHPIRMDMKVQVQGGDIYSSRIYKPLEGRLSIGTDNPDDLDWLVFSPR